MERTVYRGYPILTSRKMRFICSISGKESIQTISTAMSTVEMVQITTVMEDPIQTIIAMGEAILSITALGDPTLLIIVMVEATPLVVDIMTQSKDRVIIGQQKDIEKRLKR